MTAALKRQPDRTRQLLLECAFEEIRRSGFRAASLDAILERSGVTKGALYHHFESKTALGHAVVDEVLRPWMDDRWQAVLNADDLISAAIQHCEALLQQGMDELLIQGCPFNNLFNEMAAADAGFGDRLQAILDQWREGIAASLRRGQRAGHVRSDVSPVAAAAFLVSAIEGSMGLARARQSRAFFEAALQGMVGYLHSLRP